MPLAACSYHKHAMHCLWPLAWWQHLNLMSCLTLRFIKCRFPSLRQVRELRVKYFDTLPPCASMCVLKTGFLFAASETGNHGLYQFVGTGEDEEDVEASSSGLMMTEDGYSPVFFDPRPLKNLALVDEMPSLMPVVDMKVRLGSGHLFVVGRGGRRVGGWWVSCRTATSGLG